MIKTTAGRTINATAPVDMQGCFLQLIGADVVYADLVDADLRCRIRLAKENTIRGIFAGNVAAGKHDEA